MKNYVTKVVQKELEKKKSEEEQQDGYGEFFDKNKKDDVDEQE